MRYRELVQFDPIEDVIQLREADQSAKARDLVRTYVISERMAEQLTAVVLPQLQFAKPADNKGVLIVGNYGTGKSHLMSVLSGIAEFPDLVQVLNNDQVKAAAKDIAGRFKVARVELGSVTGSLRDLLLQELEDALTRWGTPYSFPPADRVKSTNKDDIIKAMAAFREHYPDQGVLLVVDELLDYLRSREERQLILDLGFLRELGEVVALTPFRFLGGLQESLFDNPRFSFVAQQLRRVRDRFEQVRIAREDIAYVVSHRLLRKTDQQLAHVTEHLRPFAGLYQGMAERIGEFAQLFPIHPAYIETFERVYVAEKREVLRTLSRAMREKLDKQVPQDEPGLISYDHYWDVLRDNPSMRGLPDVAVVIEKSNVLEGRIRNAYTRTHLRPLALRIIQALSVQRLTTTDIHAPLGATAEELRDGLCLHLAMPDPSNQFLLDQVQVALREIMRTVSGQYISFNEANGQYYLDVKKDIDFDAKINERGGFMEEADLNRYFFDAVGRTLNLSETTYVTGHQIWLFELPWMERKVTRPGYLFFGAPDERSTAQPPRDFYVYFIPPFYNRTWHDDKRTDEVILRLVGLDAAFRDIVRAYAGARAMAADSPTHRAVYTTKADQEHLPRLLNWLREHLSQHLEVTYQGVTEPVKTVLGKMRSSASDSLEDLLRLVSAHLLAPDFAERYPHYPTFARLREPISEEARTNDAMEAVRALAGRGRTQLATAVLEGLGLLDKEGKVRPYQSPYAKKVLELLHSKPSGQVVNRGELIETVAEGIQPIEKDVLFHLEPEWIAVLLVSLVYNGDIVLNLGTREALDAGSVERAATMALVDLVNFRSYARPKAMPVNVWTLIFEGLGLPAGLIRDENSREQAVQELQRVVGSELEATAALLSRVQPDVKLWNAPVFTDRYTIEQEGGVVLGTDRPAVTLSTIDLLPDLRGFKTFLEGLTSFNSAGKLRNLHSSVSEVQEALEQRQATQRVKTFLQAVDQLQPVTTYLAEARANLPGEHPWARRADTARQALIEDVRRSGKGEPSRPTSDWARELTALKKDYQAAYAELHQKLVLGPAGDDRRQHLYKDPRLSAMDTLASIELLSADELKAWKETIAGLRVCREFHAGTLEDTPTCPHCGTRPAQFAKFVQGDQMLDQLDHKLDDLLLRWRQALRANLTSDTAKHSLQAMMPREQKPIQAFLAQKDDDPSIPDGFVAAAQQALHGLEALTLATDDLLHALKAGGLPCTVEELQKRFAGFVQRAMRGHDAGNTRLKLDR